jgi:hypothetical protein
MTGFLIERRAMCRLARRDGGAADAQAQSPHQANALNFAGFRQINRSGGPPDAKIAAGPRQMNARARNVSA